MPKMLGYNDKYTSSIIRLKVGKGTHAKGTILDAGTVTYEDGTKDFIIDGNYLVSPKECEVLK